jgi:F-type H+-transporting ATPase subunit a
MAMEPMVSAFSWIQVLPGQTEDGMLLGLHIEDAVVVLSSWLACVAVILLAILGRLGLNRARAQGGTLQYVPDTGLSVRNFFEMFTQAFFGLAESVLGKRDARTFFPLFGGLFIYILFCNLLGVIPGFLPPTQNVSNNFAMAICVFLVFNVAGLKRNGLGYIKHMAGPVWWLAWLILPIELVGVVVRPVSLSLRLMGNIVGDHTVFGIVSSLVPWVVPSLVLALGIFVSFLQAFVFSLLTVIYIQLSVAHEEH